MTTKAKSKVTLALNRLEKFRAELDRGVVFTSDEIYFIIDNLVRDLRTVKPFTKVNTIDIIDGWKSTDHLNIYKTFQNDFVIVSHIKDKDTGEVNSVKKTISVVDVNKMLEIIRNLELNETYKCYYLAKKLGWKDWKSLWKERKLYFEQYYYPIKIFERLGLIHYGGRGSITRLK